MSIKDLEDFSALLFDSDEDDPEEEEVFKVEENAEDAGLNFHFSEVAKNENNSNNSNNRALALVSDEEGTF